MARIRTIKPEAFVSESLAEVSVTAERTFFGLLTQADDQGRHRDHAAIIAGLLWPLRPGHTPVHVEDDLNQLQSAGLVCRYTGCDGRGYLHVVTWDKHQKIDRPSQSRLPACPAHQAKQRCGACKGRCTTAVAGFGEGSASLPPPPDRPSASAMTPPAPGKASGSDGPAASGTADGGDLQAARKIPGQRAFIEASPRARRSLDEPSAPGSGILDPGSSVPSERGASAPAPPGVSARVLVGEYVSGCVNRPPRKVLGHLAKEINQLLAEGIDPDHIRAGLERFRAKPMHPSVLPSLVNEAMNAGASGTGRSGTPGGHRAWTNPADPAAYAEEL